MAEQGKPQKETIASFLSFFRSEWTEVFTIKNANKNPIKKIKIKKINKSKNNLGEVSKKATISKKLFFKSWK
jgi:hypothetical protein